MDNNSDFPSNKPRSWRSLSLRWMFLLVLVIGLPMGWWARKAQLQRAAVARIEAIGGAVLYDFEIIDPDGGATAEATDRVNQTGYYSSPSTATPSSRPWGDWVRKTLGVDYVNSVTRVIAVHAEGLRDDDLALLADLTHLESLNLGNSTIGDRGMVHVGKLRGLKLLSLNPTRLTEAGLAPLDSLDRLEKVELSYSDRSITFADLARLKSSKKLQTVKLTISGVNITDEVISSLEELTNLEYLILQSGDISPESNSRLQAALPKLNIWVFPRAHPPREQYNP